MSPETSADDDLLDLVRARLEALPSEKMGEVARQYARTVSDAGLHVVRTEEGPGTPSGAATVVPIPPLLTPVLPDLDAALAAKALLDAVIATARAIFTGRVAEPAGLFTGLTPLEDAMVRSNWRETERVASARVDFLRGDDRRLYALEVNATIPAMQGYSDIVARGFVQNVAPALGATPAAVDAALAMLPSNVDDLRLSLLAHAQETGAGRPGRWAMLARHNDSQDGELAYIAARWREAGLAPVRVTPEDFFEQGPYDLVYRHMFARRIPAGHPLEEVFRNARRHALWNPINAHLEIKGMLALVSAAGADPTLADALDLSAASREAAARALPWTRLLQSGDTTDPSGKRIADIAAFASASPQEVILKRSWDYGGRSVFLAEDFEEAKGLARLQGLAGRPIRKWADLVKFAASDPSGLWIVQQRIRPPRRRHLRVVEGQPSWGDLVTDVSAFSGAGAKFHPSGLTSRAAGGPVVNIVSGGGMAPIIPAAVLRTLLFQPGQRAR
jgi:hypothetical protein